MKKQFFTGLLFCCALAGIAQQISVNRQWQSTDGNPVINPLVNPAGLDWSASIRDVYGNIITTAHTNVSGEGENMYLTMRSASGSLLWQTDENTSGTNNEFGIALCQDATGNIYVLGTTDNGGSTNYDVMIWIFDPGGNLLNSFSYSGAPGLNDIGSDIAIEPATNDILMVCSSEGSSTSYDYHLVRYNSGGSLIYDSQYDYVSLVDVALGLDLSNAGEAWVTGASASSPGNWDYCVARFDLNTGSYVSDIRTGMPGIGLDQPLAFKRDASQNTYITGKGSSNGIDYDIFTVKIGPGPAYAVAWTQTVDLAGGEDAGTAIDVDAGNNVIVGGYTTKANNVKQFSLFKYSSAGTLLWQYHQSAQDETTDAYLRDLRVNAAGAIYYAGGEGGPGGYKEVMVGKFSPSGAKQWQRSIRSAGDNVPSGILLSLDTVLVFSVNTGTALSYQTSSYSEFATDTAVIFTSSGMPYSKQNELIVRFLPSALNITTIDNANQEYGDIRDYLNGSAYATLYSAIHGYCGSCSMKAVRIFHDFPSTYTSTVSRLGDTIPVPDFWATLLVTLPSGLSIQQAQSTFDGLPGIIGYSHPNYIGFSAAPPNDSLYSAQVSLYPSGSYSSADINVEEAWDVMHGRAGQPFVKGGVFDTGLNWQHEDFDYDGVNASSSKIAGGWDFETMTPIKTIPSGGDNYDHGTDCAGIIGASRNNQKGIAGIAGGNYTLSPVDKGVSLYGLRIFNSSGGFFPNPNPLAYSLTIAYVSDAIRNSAINDLSISQYGYGLNFMNHSWAIYTDTTYGNYTWKDTNLVLLDEAVHFANRQKVTFVACRGNWQVNVYNQLAYPACIDDDWVLNVGGSGVDGGYIHDVTWFCTTPVNGEFAAYFGNDVDVTAPASNSLMITTGAGGGYRAFNGTSGATPHVSGVVALLMSYMNDTSATSDYKNLAPEDCEFIIQKSATDTDSSGYDIFSGWGRLNAGKALRLVEKPYHILYHFGTDVRSGCAYTLSKSLYSNSDTILLTERYRNQASTWFKKGKYLVKTYEITANISHNFGFGTDSVIYYWPRPSSSNVLELFTGTEKKLRPRERVKITSFNSSNATLKGYIYQVKDLSGNALGWWPFDTTLTNLKFEYSVLAKNTAVGIHNYTKEPDGVTLFPNPTSHEQTLVIESEGSKHIKVQLYDLMGRQLKTVYDGKATGEKTVLQPDVSGLPNSMYLYTIRLDDKIVTKRFIKQ